MTSSHKPSIPDYSNVDLDVLLEQRRQVAVIWCIEDVQSVCPNLTDDEAWAVLKKCRDKHDCEQGFTWDLIENAAELLFPEPTDQDDG